MTLFWTKTRKMSELNKKKAGTNNDNSPTSSSANKGGKDDQTNPNWFKNNLWTVILVLVGVVIFIFGIFLKKSPDLADVGSWSRNHWLTILILWGIIAGLIALNAGKAAKTLQAVIATIVFALFIGFPIIGWVADSGSTDQHRAVSAQASIPLASAPVAEWPKIILPPGGKSELIPVPSGMHIVMNGDDFLLHNVYTDGHESAFGEPSCVDGPLAGAYATNKTRKTNIVSYAFSK
ncbi:MAG: hypothetical protein WC887_01010 [Candidatus Paceibacterota bacterium]|jgi:hypothetical protein